MVRPRLAGDCFAPLGPDGVKTCVSRAAHVAKLQHRIGYGEDDSNSKFTPCRTPKQSGPLRRAAHPETGMEQNRKEFE